MKLQDLSALISVREFAVRNLDNIYFNLSKEEVKLLRNKITVLDKQITDGILKLNPDEIATK